MARHPRQGLARASLVRLPQQGREGGTRGCEGSDGVRPKGRGRGAPLAWPCGHCMGRWRTDGLGAMVGAWWSYEAAERAARSVRDVDLMRQIEEYNEVDYRVMWEAVKYFRCGAHHAASVVGAGLLSWSIRLIWPDAESLPVGWQRGCCGPQPYTDRAAGAGAGCARYGECQAGHPRTGRLRRSQRAASAPACTRQLGSRGSLSMREVIPCLKRDTPGELYHSLRPDLGRIPPTEALDAISESPRRTWS